MTKEEIFSAIFKDVESCYHLPDLKNMVFLAMDSNTKQETYILDKKIQELQKIETKYYTLLQATEMFLKATGTNV